MDRIRELARHASDVNVQISLEMYEDTYLGTARDPVCFVMDVDHPSVKLNIDIGNLIRLHRPVDHWSEMIEQCIPCAGYWHVKNYYPIEDLSRNFAPIMAMPAARTVAQVSHVVQPGGIDPEAVVTPGIFVDAIVAVPNPAQEEDLNRADAYYPKVTA